MKVLMINGSPHEKGCTNAALKIIAKELEEQGIESEIVWIGTSAVHSCTGCGFCNTKGYCVFSDDVMNGIGDRVKNADGYIFGSPVHYASPAGSMIALMDRLFWCYGSYMKYKPAAAIVSARRAGTTASCDVMNKYFGINSMIQVPSTYWNMVHGSMPKDVAKDAEGVSIMKAIGSNMAWLLKVLDSVKGTDLERPVEVPKARTNFIR
ncbi:MAG: flavodoxin family protein [Clostridia bacterium]|nr:flavodoxin family protein [Clostridia bacterium]